MELPSRYIDQYQLLHKIGEGGLGEVWRAMDMRLGRPVAIKLLKFGTLSGIDLVQRFTREAVSVASLRHPNIVTLHDFRESQQGNPPFMVMDLIEGPTLDTYIRQTSRRGQFPSQEELLYIFTCIAQALDYAHEHNVVHRDIKPSNILLDQYRPSDGFIGVPVLTDFGIARRPGEHMTLVGQTEGTPAYMAPEQAQGHEADKRSDIYSLGILLYEMFVGTVPFHGDSPVIVMTQHLLQPPPPPHLLNPRVTIEVENVILKCLEKNPALRYEGCMEIVNALALALHLPAPDAAMQDTAGEASESTPLPLAQPARDRSSERKPEKRLSRMPFIIAGSGVTLALIVMIVFVGLTNFGPKGPLTVSRGTVTSVSGEVGQIKFVHIGNERGYTGLQIDLQHVPAPPAGKVYYAWIIPQGNETFDAHWPLVVKDQQIHSGTLTDPTMGNLLVPDSNFLITQEDNNGIAPVVPALDTAQHFFYASIMPITATTFTVRPCSAGTNAVACH